jgi:hypothetical protein
VTQIVTCFRIRPLLPLFEGKTLLIVDTPGYGDSRGIERDAFVTAAMSVFFKTVSHVNAIIFICRANEARITLLSPVSTYVFSLFAMLVHVVLKDGGVVAALAASAGVRPRHRHAFCWPFRYQLEGLIEQSLKPWLVQ